MPANTDDPSVWASAGETISHYDTFEPSNLRHVKLVPGPRAYIRVTPAGWRKALPTVNEIERYDNNFAVRAPAEGVASGDFGPTEEGFISYWLTGKDETKNVVMFFDETGEFWVLHGTAFFDQGASRTLAVGSVLKNWSSTIRRANFLFDRLGASPVRRVEVGLVGLTGSPWPGQFSADQKPARKDRFIIDAVAEIGRPTVSAALLWTPIRGLLIFSACQSRQKMRQVVSSTVTMSIAIYHHPGSSEGAMKRSKFGEILASEFCWPLHEIRQ